MGLVSEIKDLIELLILLILAYLAWRYLPLVWKWIQQHILTPIGHAAEQARKAIQETEKRIAETIVGVSYPEEAAEAVEQVYPAVSTVIEKSTEVARRAGIPVSPVSTEIAKTIATIIAGHDYAQYLRRRRIAKRISIPVTYRSYLQWLYWAKLVQIGGYPPRPIPVPALTRAGSTTWYIM